jgi:hypothetical protein
MQLDKIWKANKMLILAGIGLYILLKFRSVFAPGGAVLGTLVDTLQIKATAAQAQAAAAAATKTAQAQVQSDKAKSVVLGRATGSDIENYKIDAAAIATALGTRQMGFFEVDFTKYVEDEQAAFNVLKKYTKNITRNGKVIAPRDLKYRVQALEPFYKELTGNSLKADAYKYLSEQPYKALLTTIW